MPRHKKTRRRRQWTPRPSVWRRDPPDELDELTDALDIEDELEELERLMDNRPAPHAPFGVRPLRMQHHDFVRAPLTRAWAARVGDCGAGIDRLARGLDYIVSGAVLVLEVGKARIAATVQGSRRYRVVVDVVLPPEADRRAALERVQHARAAALPGTDAVLAVQQAIVAGGSHLFPSPAQLGPECSCPDGAPCKHVVAAVVGLGVLLSREPELLFAFWGFSRAEISAQPMFVLPPLAPDRRPLDGDLGAVFGIDLPDVVGPRKPPTQTDGEAPSIEEPVTPAPSLPAPPSERAEVRRDYLRVLGLSARTIDAWLRAGVLLPTDRKDIYERTPQANRKIASFLAR